MALILFLSIEEYHRWAIKLKVTSQNKAFSVKIVSARCRPTTGNSTDWHQILSVSLTRWSIRNPSLHLSGRWSSIALKVRRKMWWFRRDRNCISILEMRTACINVPNVFKKGIWKILLSWEIFLRTCREKGILWLNLKLLNSTSDFILILMFSKERVHINHFSLGFFNETFDDI